VDYKVILSSRFIRDNNLISQLGAKIFIIFVNNLLINIKSLVVGRLIGT